MLTGFDWLRRSRTGAELLATLKYLEVKPDLFPGDEKKIGPPHSALDGPCQRCWVYPRRSYKLYCESCQAILARANKLGSISRQAIVLWGFVNQLPRQLQTGEGFGDTRVFGTFVHDKNHFLLVMGRRELKPWTQELVLYHGSNLKWLIQIFPTTGEGRQASMGDILCRAIHHEARFTMDQLRVRFYSAPYQVLVPHVRDREKVLTFEVTEFLGLLEMAAVFRTLLDPEAQKALYELLSLEDTSEEQFYWGRFLGYLSPKAKDMLNAWKVRQWPKSQIKLLYELTDYVVFYQSG